MNTTATTNADTRNPYSLAHRFGSIFLVATAELDLLDDQATTEELATQVALERFEDAGLAALELYAINGNQAEAVAVALVAEGIRSAGCTRPGIAQAIALEAVGYVADHGREFVELEEAAAGNHAELLATAATDWLTGCISGGVEDATGERKARDPRRS